MDLLDYSSLNAMCPLELIASMRAYVPVIGTGMQCTDDKVSALDSTGISGSR